MRQPAGRLFYAAALFGTAWVVAHVAGLLGPLSDATFGLLGAGTTASILIGAHRFQPARRWPWFLLAVSVVFYLVGGLLRLESGTLGDLTAGRWMVPDIVTLPGYLCSGAGLVGMLRARRRAPGRDLDALLDGIVAALAASTLAWVFLINPALTLHDAPLKVRLSLAWCPPLSVMLVTIVIQVGFSWGRRPSPAQRLLVAALSAMLAGDVVYTLIDARILDMPRRLADAPYALAYLCFALDALHPSMHQLTEAVRADETAPSRARLGLVAVSLAVPGIVMLGGNDFHGGNRAVLVAIVIALTAIATWRMLRALRAHAWAEARFAYQATHDPLTGLPNRLFVEEHLAQSLERARAGATNVALLFLDIDRFKLVNDSRGHRFGDELLVEVSQRLRTNVRPGDIVARIGGDEFLIVLSDVGDLGHAMRLAERVHLCFEVPFGLRGIDIHTSASIGLAFADVDALGHGPAAGVDAESLIRDADTAMYQAKDAGRDGVAVFDGSMRDRVAERLALEQDLRSALSAHELHVHFQPILSLGHGGTVGFEALVRWQHPTRGLVPPTTFIPIAEDIGLIGEIGRWVLEQSCVELAGWRRVIDGSDDLYVAVNLSARQLRSGLSEAVSDVLARCDLPAEALCLELTESILMDDPDFAVALLSELRAAGITLSVDDFGTGYSSLAYLKRFPVNTVKIDRAFVIGLDSEDSSDESLVAAIIAMADALGMSTVAEGIETEGQAQRLAAMGCTRAQGYLYSRPVPAALVPATLHRLGVGPARSDRAGADWASPFD